MSPEAKCPRCGRKQTFHDREFNKKGSLKKKVMCVECGLEREYEAFLGEVIVGEHSEAVAEFEAQLREQLGYDEEE
jgi:transcription elongation factor Elf1